MSEAEAPKFEITFERTLAHHDQWQMGIVAGAAATLFLDFLELNFNIVKLFQVY